MFSKSIKLLCLALLISVGVMGSISSKAQASPQYETSPDDCFVIIDTDSGQVPEITCAQEIPSAYIKIGSFFKDLNFAGSKLNFVTANLDGCEFGAVFGLSYMPTGWDNQASSSKGYNYCWNNDHFPNQGFGGTPYVCTQVLGCPNLSFVNDKVSSVKWKSN